MSQDRSPKQERPNLTDSWNLKFPMKPQYTWRDLPHVTASFRPSVGGESNGAILLHQRAVINFLLYPQGLFAVIRADPQLPVAAISAFGRIVRIHCRAKWVRLFSDDEPHGLALPSRQIEGKGQQRTLRCWSISVGTCAAELQILDDPCLPMAEVSFGEWTSEGRTSLIAGIVLHHRWELSRRA